MITVLIMSGIFNPPKSPVDTTIEGEVVADSSKHDGKNLQLIDLPIRIKATPTPSDACTGDSGKPVGPDCVCPDAHVICEKGKCVKIIKELSGPFYQDSTCEQWDKNGWCGPMYAPEDGKAYCIGKPVIYLYPEKDTLVDVAVKTAGKIAVSDPLYPVDGWKDVLAHPDGTLIYKNKQYRELFYESETHDLKRPKAGIVITKQNLKTDLLSFITQLGLTREDEQNEFLDWWLPRLAQIKTDKIFVSILENDEKQRLDKVIISPKPNTMIEFIVYFAPLSNNETVIPLILPPTPIRTGFTAVEWGGVIGK